MKYLILFILPLYLCAKTYMGVVKPKEEFTLYSKTSGEIIMINKNDETKVVNKEIIQIDKKLEEDTLKLYLKQLHLIEEELGLRERSYKKYLTIKGKSQVDKDDKLIEIIELKNTILELKLKITEVKNTIKNKSIYVKELYVKEYYVNKFDYVTSGTKIATLYDISQGKIILYINKRDYKDIQNKTIYINNKATKLKINKLDKTTDSVFLSSYKVEILLNRNDFGIPIKVEFLNEK